MSILLLPQHCLIECHGRSKGHATRLFLFGSKMLNTTGYFFIIPTGKLFPLDFSVCANFAHHRRPLFISVLKMPGRSHMRYGSNPYSSVIINHPNISVNR